VKRLLWLGIGLAVGVLVVRAVSKRMNALTPESIAGSVRESAGGFADSVRSFVEDVRIGMAEREAEIQAAFTEGTLLEYDEEEGQ
jgi:hypothetical protein